MHGFFGSFGLKREWDLSSYIANSWVIRTHEAHTFSLTQVTQPKFLKDKCFHEEDGCFIATEGVLFEACSPTEAIRRYRKGDMTFWDSWRGSFCGILYDGINDILLIFNDHIGSKMLFYVQTEDGFVFSSDLRLLAKSTDLCTPNEDFERMLLKYGCTNDNDTFVKNIYRLTAGQYLYVQRGKYILESFHQFDNTPWAYEEPQMLAKTDMLFRQAVSRVIHKNEEEGLQHYFPLSGGLDSRMTQWIAHEIATMPITNFTYSQSGHYDHLLPQEISRMLGNEWRFMPLDGGDYITDIEQCAAETEWLVNYMGPIEIATFARQQDWRQKGVVLTGVNGDNIFAAEVDNAHEMARIYTQGFNGNSLGSPLVLQNYTESYSPFCDVDVLDYVLHVPTDKRRNYYFYDRWILAYYPAAAQWHHKYEQIGRRHRMLTVAGRNIRMRDMPKRIIMSLMKRLHIYDAYRARKGVSMNPYDDWVKENPHILATLADYYSKHKHLLNNPTIAEACAEKMQKGTIMEKGKALTIVSALNTFAHIGE